MSKFREQFNARARARKKAPTPVSVIEMEALKKQLASPSPTLTPSPLGTRSSIDAKKTLEIKARIEEICKRLAAHKDFVKQAYRRVSRGR